jgi:hypothetical protein
MYDTLKLFNGYRARRPPAESRLSTIGRAARSRPLPWLQLLKSHSKAVFTAAARAAEAVDYLRSLQPQS